MAERLSRIYTRSGDAGSTALADGSRVAKDHPRIEALGEIDSLNSQLGVLLALLGELEPIWPGLTEVIEVLAPCQQRLFDLGGELAMPQYQTLEQAETSRLEQVIDRWNAELGPLQEFILPGGSLAIAQAHVCRSAARSAERRCQTLNAIEPLRSECLAYVNRLSDLLFVAARLIARRQRIADVLWQPAARPQA